MDKKVSFSDSESENKPKKFELNLHDEYISHKDLIKFCKKYYKNHYKNIIIQKGDKGDDGPRGKKGDDGPRGKKGERGPRGFKGKGLKWKGIFDINYDYEKYDVVIYNGSSYIAIDCSIGIIPDLLNNLYWELICSKGEMGIQGIQGEMGIQGIQGIQGEMGVPGLNILTSYAHMYGNNQQLIGFNNNILFESINIVTPDINYNPLNGNILFNINGIYKIKFFINSNDPFRMGLFLNNILIPYSIFEISNINIPLQGELLQTINNNDILNIRNIGNTNINLFNNGAINLYMIILKIS